MRTLIKVAIRLVVAFMIYDIVRANYEVIASILLNIGRGFQDPWYYYAAVLMGFFVMIIVLLLFWIKADYIVHFIAGPIHSNEITINTSNVDLLSVAFSVLGVYLIVNSLTDIAFLYAYQWQLGVYTPPGTAPSQSAWEGGKVAMDILGILIGLGLILGKKGTKKVFKWLNEIGKSSEEVEES